MKHLKRCGILEGSCDGGEGLWERQEVVVWAGAEKKFKRKDGCALLVSPRVWTKGNEVLTNSGLDDEQDVNGEVCMGVCIYPTE